MTEPDRSIERVARDIANKCKADFDLSQEQEETFIRIAENEFKQTIGKHTLPGAKPTSKKLQKEIIENIGEKLTQRLLELIGSDINHKEKSK